MRLCLYEPDIPQNLGSAIRLTACLGVDLDIVEPCGFALTDKAIARAALDYNDCAKVSRHVSFEAYLDFKAQHLGRDSRLILMTTKSAKPFTSFDFGPNDIILMGRESAGVPDSVHNISDARLFIPLVKGMRSLNVINAAAITLARLCDKPKALPA